MNKNISITIVVAILVGSGSFFAGIKYQQTKSAKDLQNMSPEQRQALFSQYRGQNGQGGQRRGNGNGFVGGEILNKDDKSITIKTRDGGSKIVFLSSSTTFGKTTEATVTDLEIGKQVMISGTSNLDGSLTAQNIQIRPSMDTFDQTTK